MRFFHALRRLWGQTNTHLALVQAVVSSLDELYLESPRVGTRSMNYAEALVVRVELSA